MVTFSPSQYAEMRARMERSRAGRAGLTPSKIAQEVIKRSKYGNIKTNGFDSKKEYHRSIVLNAMADNGQISHLRKQVTIVLQEKFRDCDGKMVRAIKYIPDFVYTRDGKTIVEDVKSEATRKKESYRIKVKMLKAKFPEYIFIET